MRNVNRIQIWGACLITLCVASAIPSKVHARGGNPWASEVGEARDVARTATRIASRLRDKYPFRPAASTATALDRSASQLKSLVENGASYRSIQSMTNETRSVGSQVHRQVASDRQMQSDHQLVSSFAELNQQLDRLDRELDKSYTRNGGGIDRHGHRVHTEPEAIYRNRETPRYGHRHEHIEYRRHADVDRGPTWNNPFYPNHSSYRPPVLPETRPHHPQPTVVVPVTPIGPYHPAIPAPLGRRVLSAVLEELVHGL